MIDSTTEARLVAALADSKRDQQAALRELFELLQAPLFGMALRMTGRPDLADDAVQEAFVDVLRGARTFRGDARLTTWVYRVALRAATRVAARAERRRSVALPEELIGHAPDPATSTEQRESASRVLAAIAALSAPQRSVVALSALQDVPLVEIAAILGIPEGTVHSRLHAARTKLRESLGKGA